MLSALVRVEEGPVSEHGAGDGEESVHDLSDGTPVCMAFRSHGVVLGPADRVVLDGDFSPVVGCVAESFVGGQSSDDDQLVAGLHGHRRDAAEATQRIAISAFEALVGFTEQGGQANRADAGQGPQDGCVARLGRLVVVFSSRFL